MPNEYWWNADFDLALQPGWDPSDNPGLEAQVRELALHALVAVSPEDSVLLAENPPEDFLRYLERNALPVPQISILPDVRPDFEFTPYGWSPQAMALKCRYSVGVSSPPLETVRHVNGRSFGHRLERELQDSKIPRGAFASLLELKDILNSEPNRPDGWIAKTEHGNAALGNRRLRTRHLDERDIKWLNPRLKQGPMVLEWWLNRTVDLCSVFHVSKNGRPESLTIHEAIQTADGAFIGALYDQTSTAHSAWRDALIHTADTVAKALLMAGYFGPVCVDAFVWDDQGASRLRPLVDLNARRHASEGWRRLAQKWDGCLYGRFFSTRKLRLPPTYEEFERMIRYNEATPARDIGAIATSPLWLESEGARHRPRKIGIVFRGHSREHVFSMETRFREVFEK